MFLVAALPSGDSAWLDGDEGHHAARVRRVVAGERIAITDGAGGMAACVVRAVVGATVELAVLERTNVALPSPRLVVVQALAKADRGELAVEVMTELGVDEIVPWSAARSVTRWRGERGDKARQRWVATARTATKQAQRAWLPAIAALADPAGVAARLRSASAAIVLDPDAPVALNELELPSAGDILVVVGPEGGLGAGEIDLFTAAGAVPGRLGPTVLRTSTAGAAALAVLSARLGRWS